MQLLVVVLQVLFLVLLLPSLSAAASAQPEAAPEPWERAGLDPLTAARHALSRLTYGARPGEAERLAAGGAAGLRRWLDLQLEQLDDAHRWQPAVLEPLPLLAWSAEDLVAELGTRPLLRRQAIARGLVREEDLDGSNGRARQRDAEAVLESLARSPGGMGGEDSGWPVVELMRHQRLVRGLEMESQLHEVLSDFWFNHFNVSANKPAVLPHLISYERDAIRPHLGGAFADLLLATASHPAMLVYLDNAVSRAPRETLTTLDHAFQIERIGPLSNPSDRAFAARLLGWQEPTIRRTTNDPRDPIVGLNENYARELLELHTLGVDGGYTAEDVVDLARTLTGWTTMPYHGRERRELLRVLEREELARELGFVRSGEFLFRPGWHDAGGKRVLDLQLEEGGGFPEAVTVLERLAEHPSTAHRIAGLLAQRFVSTVPPERLVRRVAARYESSGGDLGETMAALVESEEFWQPSPVPLRKSPLEFLLSALRGLDARAVRVEAARSAPLGRALERLGQPLYRYDPPTGFPPVDGAWFSSGALLERVNLAHQLAYAQTSEVQIDLEALAGDEARSPEAAMRRALDLLLPERLPETEDRFQEALALQTLGPRRWFSAALALVLASPEFQLR